MVHAAVVQRQGARQGMTGAVVSQDADRECLFESGQHGRSGQSGTRWARLIGLPVHLLLHLNRRGGRFWLAICRGPHVVDRVLSGHQRRLPRLHVFGNSVGLDGQKTILALETRIASRGKDSRRYPVVEVAVKGQRGNLVDS